MGNQEFGRSNDARFIKSKMKSQPEVFRKNHFLFKPLQLLNSNYNSEDMLRKIPKTFICRS